MNPHHDSAAPVGASLAPASPGVDVRRWSKGVFVYGVLVVVYDYVVFGFVIWALGPLLGGGILALSTACLDYLCLRFYQESSRDWLALEYLRSMREYGGRSVWRRCVGWVLRDTPKAVQVLALTPYSNAFLTTVLLRDGSATFAPLTGRDWVLFWTSFLLSQAYWTTLVWLGVAGLGELVSLAMGGAS